MVFCRTSYAASNVNASFYSWIKTDQLDVTWFIISLFNARHVSNINTSIFRSLRIIVDLFHVMVLRCGSAGVVWYPYARFSLHKDTTTCWAVNSKIINKWHKVCLFYSTIKMMHGPINFSVLLYIHLWLDSFCRIIYIISNSVLFWKKLKMECFSLFFTEYA